MLKAWTSPASLNGSFKVSKHLKQGVGALMRDVANYVESGLTRLNASFFILLSRKNASVHEKIYQRLFLPVFNKQHRQQLRKQLE